MERMLGFGMKGLPCNIASSVQMLDRRDVGNIKGRMAETMSLMYVPKV